MVPVIGSIVAMVLGPYEFWEAMRRQAEQSAVGWNHFAHSPSHAIHRDALPGLSWNSLVGHFLVFSGRAEITAKVMTMMRDGM